MNPADLSADLALIQAQRFPLNVYTFIAREQFGSAMLHFGCFEADDEDLRTAQERASAVLDAALPPPPARVVEVGIGFGVTLARLMRRGYEVVGITPEAVQRDVALRNTPDASIALGNFEQVAAGLGTADAVIFQESAQYIDPAALWQRCARLARPGTIVVIADEFRTARGAGSGVELHVRDEFIATARQWGFELYTARDLGREATPTLRCIREGVVALRARIERDLRESADNVDALLAAIERHERDYRSGAVTYALMTYRASGA